MKQLFTMFCLWLLVIFEGKLSVVKDTVKTPSERQKEIIHTKVYFCYNTNEWHLRYVWSDHITFSNILFDLNSYTLNPHAKKEIDDLVAALKTHPEIKIGISGHTCDLGTKTSNQSLSERRAQSVYNALRQNGIHTNRMLCAGCNYEIPIVPNDTEENRMRNRRVEIMIAGINEK